MKFTGKSRRIATLTIRERVKQAQPSRPKIPQSEFRTYRNFLNAMVPFLQQFDERMRDMWRVEGLVYTKEELKQIQEMKRLLENAITPMSLIEEEPEAEGLSL